MLIGKTGSPSLGSDGSYSTKMDPDMPWFDRSFPHDPRFDSWFLTVWQASTSSSFSSTPKPNPRFKILRIPKTQEAIGPVGALAADARRTPSERPTAVVAPFPDGQLIQALRGRKSETTQEAACIWKHLGASVAVSVARRWHVATVKSPKVLCSFAPGNP